jgi:catechol 2,3-dioxygenase-like lactoylglutathione lyase family enzyme
MIKGVSTVWLPVSDIDRSRRFYKDTLGLEERETDGDWAEVVAQDLVIGLNARDSEEPSSEGGAVIAFAVDDSIESTMEDLKGKGVEFVGGISEHPWGRLAAFKDPDGHDLELYEPPK